jgi:type II secretory ATPase GspE/PulE/Tfp pilus assembly ATPase PilB-like protein
MATTGGKTYGRSAGLDAGRRKIEASIAEAGFDDLTGPIAKEIAALLLASPVRVYLRDTLTDELYCRLTDAKGARERRVPPDTSNVVGYSAMQKMKAYAWMGDMPNRRYVVAIPMLAGGEVLGSVEMVHSMPNAVIDDARIETFNGIVQAMAKRIQALQKTSVRSSPYDYLLKSKLVTAEALREARERAAAEGRSVESILLASGIDKMALGRSLAEHFERPFTAEPGSIPISSDLVRRFSGGFLRSNAVLPVALKSRTLEAVVMNPRNLTLLDDLSRQLGGVPLSLSVGIREDILAALEKVIGPADAPAPAMEVEPAPAAPASRDWELAPPAGGRGSGDEQVKIDSATVRLVNRVIQAAIDSGASDIHFEPLENAGLIIRFRVDGVCHDHETIREAVSRQVVSRLKIMSELDIAEHRLPQDGKIRLRDASGQKTDLRVAVMPTSHGFEDIVLRILPQRDALSLKDLGMEPDNLERFRRAIEQPHGIVLCVGPTGSGKTTTLHAALGHLKNPQVKIWTAEDPVEITQDRVRQVQVNAKIGFTFERALRTFLRLDPDIIMIGEIRDRETADAAIEASLTGHLVLSTLHTNSAPETVTRLLEMGLDPFAFGDSLMAVLAQRLVRTLCSSCRETYVAKPEEIDALRGHYGDPAAFDALKVDRKRTNLSRGKGCGACYQTGYKGRLGIHELLVVTPDIRQLVQKRAEAATIRTAARAQGMTILKQDGIRKVLRGDTDIHEVLATCLSEQG